MDNPVNFIQDGRGGGVEGGQNAFVWRRSRVAIFADSIKIVTMFIKTIFKDSKKVRRIRNYVSKCNLYLYFLI